MAFHEVDGAVFVSVCEAWGSVNRPSDAPYHTGAGKSLLGRSKKSIAVALNHGEQMTPRGFEPLFSG